MTDTVTLEEISGDKIVIVRVHENDDLSSYKFCLTAIINGTLCELKGFKDDAEINLHHIKLIGKELYVIGVGACEWIHHKKQFKVKLVKVDNEVKIKKVQ